jgi:serine/threonine protein kinase
VSPRRFAVLEYLKGRTLADKLESKLSIADKVFHKPRFPLTEVLLLAEQLADALDYLHRRFHPDACIIHRDIKPDNIGFSSDGSVKIFDFGLCVCVKKFTKETAAYTMSGNTGTLRYMAPEVALEQAYNEKVDIYSLGILLWQVAADAVPYHGITRREFMKFVVRQEARPVLSFSWSLELRSLFERMWDADATSRPTSLQVLDTVRRLRTMDTDGTTIA